MTLTAEGKVHGGTVAYAEVELYGVVITTITEGSPRSKGARGEEVRNNPRYQSPQNFLESKNHAEQNVLGDVADEIDGAMGNPESMRGVPKPAAEGFIHLHVEQTVCAACRQGLADHPVTLLPGVVKQFSSEYPSMVIVITNELTDEVLIVENGSLVGAL